MLRAPSLLLLVGGVLQLEGTEAVPPVSLPLLALPYALLADVDSSKLRCALVPLLLASLEGGEMLWLALMLLLLSSSAPWACAPFASVLLQRTCASRFTRAPSVAVSGRDAATC